MSVVVGLNIVEHKDIRTQTMNRTSRFGLIPELFDQIQDNTNKLKPVNKITDRQLSESPDPYSQWGLLINATNRMNVTPEISERNEETIEGEPIEKDQAEFRRLSKAVQTVAENFYRRAVEEAEKETRKVEEQRRQEEERRLEEERQKKEEERRLEEERQKKEEERRLEEERQKKEERRLEEERQAHILTKTDSQRPETPRTYEEATELVTSRDHQNQNIEYLKQQLEGRREWKQYLDGEYKEIKNNSEIKKFRVDSKKSINLAINQIASTSSQIDNVSSKLTCIMRPYFNNPSLFRFLATSIVTSLLDNVEIQLCSNPKSVWCYGSLLSRLCDVSGFYPIVESCFKFTCVYCVPSYVTKTKQMSNEEFSELRNQRTDELELAYFQRMSSYLRLWLVLLVYRKDRIMYWIWWTNFVLTNPKRITSFLLSAALEVSAFFGLHFFPKQFSKLLQSAVIGNLMPKLYALKEKDSTGVLAASITQSSIKLEEFRLSGRFSVPDGFQMKLSEFSISKYSYDD